MSNLVFHAPCKTGQLQVDTTTVQATAPFGKIVWSIPRDSITRIVQQSTGAITVDLTIITVTGLYPAPYMTKKNAAKFLAFFPGLTVEMPAGDLWYLDPTRRTYIATYTDEQTTRREMEAASHYGWMPQDTTGTAGHINVGRTATAAALTGGVSLLFGASRSKDKITITYVRTPEWLASQMP